MPANPSSVQQAIQNAADALRRGDKQAARHWAQLAAAAAPQLEEPWLILAAVSSPHAAIEYLKQALLANPGSERAIRGLRWAQERLGPQQPTQQPELVRLAATQPSLAATQQVRVRKPAPQPAPRPAAKHRSVLPWLSVPALFVLLACLVVAWAVWPGSSSAALAQFGNTTGTSQGAPAWSPAQIAKPTQTSTITTTPSPLPSPTATATPFVPSTSTATPLPTDAPTSVPPTSSLPVVGNYTIQSGDTLFSIAQRAGITADALAATNQISVYSTIYAGQVLNIPQGGTVPDPVVQPTAAVEGPAPSAGKYILVSISQQHLYAYDGNTLVYSFVASTGMNNSTRVGQFQILDKIPNAYGATWNIWMPNWMGIYYAGSLEDGIHALPILSNGSRLWAGYLGTPISFGCIVLGVQEAQELYDWADVGTTVEITR